LIVFLLAIAPDVAKRKSFPPRAGSQSQSITHGGTFCWMPAVKVQLEICQSALDVVPDQTFDAPFDFVP
jgi:hypothetical protein